MPNVGLVAHSSTLTFICDKFYAAEPSTDMVRTCMNGNWSISLSLNPIVCHLREFTVFTLHLSCSGTLTHDQLS